MNLTLYQLADQYLAAISAIPDDATDEQVHLALAGLQGEITVKCQNVAAYCLNIEAEADAVDGAAKKLKARADTARRRAEGLRAYLFQNMKAVGVSEIKATDGTFKAKIVKNPPAVEILGPVPAEYERVIPERREPDKAKLKDDLKAGVIIDGARLVQGERLKLD
jgi:hypothetical protein